MKLDSSVIIDQLPAILSGLSVTVSIWLSATFTGMVLGILVAILRHYGGAVLRTTLLTCVETIRGTPFLIQIFLVYFGGPFIGLRLDPIPAGYLCLSIYAAAYFSEIFRAGILAIPKGHLEAADCAGLSRAQTIRRIILPEMAVLALPQSVNLIVTLLKETAVLSIITVPEMTLVIGAIGSQQYAYAEAMLLLALIYWLLVELSAALGRFTERKLSRYRFS